MTIHFLFTYLFVLSLFFSFKNKSPILLEGISIYKYYTHGQNVPLLTEGKFILRKNKKIIKNIILKEVWIIMKDEKIEIKNFTMHNKNFQTLNEPIIDDTFYISIDPIQLTPLYKKSYGIEIKIDIQFKNTYSSLVGFSETKIIRKNPIQLKK